MKKKYRYMTFALGLVLVIVINSYYIASFSKVKDIYNNRTEEIVLNLKKSFLKDTVNNILLELDYQRENIGGYYKSIVKRRIEDIKVLDQNSEEELLKELKIMFESDVDSELWTILVKDRLSGQILYSKNAQDDKGEEPGIEGLKEELLASSMIENNRLIGIYGIKKAYREETVKKEMAEKIKSLDFENDSYIWVNEIVNYEGGENYAIRRIHPNLEETEGIYLSTDIRDEVGNQPYLEELKGINKNGEAYLRYYFRPMNSEKASEKISYAKLYEDYNWVVSMGVHIDDLKDYANTLNEENKNLVTQFYSQLLAILTLIVAVGSGIILFLEDRYHSNEKKELEEEMNKDLLTGALSRRGGTKALADAFIEFRKVGVSTSIMMIDLDNFKQINDSFGHPLGDSALVETIDSIHRNIRSTDKLIRWGGDEFIGIFYGLDENNIPNLANKILEDINKIEIETGSFNGENQESIMIYPTISIGFSLFKDNDSSYSDAISRADRAMYRSKEQGRNTYNVEH